MILCKISFDFDIASQKSCELPYFGASEALRGGGGVYLSG